MSPAAPSGLVVRTASALDAADAGALTAEAYLADRLVSADDAYTVELRDAERRRHEATLLVAALVPAPDHSTGEQDRGVVLGTITLAPYGSSYAEIAEPGELELRMLAVAPEARRRGVAEALMAAALREAVGRGARRVVLSTDDGMGAAQRLYERLGFERQPHRDWGHVEVHLRVMAWTPPAAPGALVEAATWRPATLVEVEGWRVGETAGLTRRANSTLPVGQPEDVDSALAHVEAFYAACGLPSVFRVCSAARPIDLDERLAARGYEAVATTDVLVCDLPLVGDAGAARVDGVRLVVAGAPDDAWLDVWSATKSGTSGDDEHRERARSILTRSPALYVTAIGADGPLGVIRAAFAEDWVGLACLVVAPHARRLGLGRALTLRALDEAFRRGARRAFLQVEASNGAAARLYDALGFRPAERYHYRQR